MRSGLRPKLSYWIMKGLMKTLLRPDIKSLTGTETKTRKSLGTEGPGTATANPWSPWPLVGVSTNFPGSLKTFPEG